MVATCATLLITMKTLIIILIFCIGTIALEIVSHADMLSSKSSFKLGWTIKINDGTNLRLDTYTFDVCGFGAWDPTKL